MLPCHQQARVFVVDWVNRTALLDDDEDRDYTNYCECCVEDSITRLKDQKIDKGKD